MSEPQKRARDEGEAEEDAPAKAMRIRDDADDGEIDEDGQEVHRPPPPEPAVANEDAIDQATGAATATDAASASAASEGPEATAAAAAAGASAAATDASALPASTTASVPAPSTSTDESITDEELVQLLRSRAEAKSRRDFAGADAIRSELEAKGIKIVDARASGMVGTWTDRNGRR